VSICVKDSITIPYSTEAESLIINARVPYDQEAMDIYNKFKADLETDFGPLNTFPFSMLASLPFSMLASLPFSMLASLPFSMLASLPFSMLASLPFSMLASLPFSMLASLPFSMLASLPFSMLASLPFSIWNKEIVHGFTAAIAEYERCSRLQYEKQAKV